MVLPPNPFYPDRWMESQLSRYYLSAWVENWLQAIDDSYYNLISLIFPPTVQQKRLKKRDFSLNSRGYICRFEVQTYVAWCWSYGILS